MKLPEIKARYVLIAIVVGVFLLAYKWPPTRIAMKGFWEWLNFKMNLDFLGGSA